MKVITLILQKRCKTFNKEIALPIPYSIRRTPATVATHEVFSNPEAGTNCELLVQAFVRARGFYIPALRSSELYEDQLFTRLIDDPRQIQTGDILGFCEVEKIDFYGIHVGLAWVDNRNLRVVHNARHIGQAQVEDLEEVLAYEKHARLVWIKRPILKNPFLFNPGKLQELGFPFLVPSYNPPATTSSAFIVA